MPLPKARSGFRTQTQYYKRKVQDLPILGKTTYLLINAYEYQCENPSCDVTTYAESVNGFLNYYSRMTERCEDFICTLAWETSGEGCARICRVMNLKTSGDSVIRLLSKRFAMQPEIQCGSVIGVDDFAFKKDILTEQSLWMKQLTSPLHFLMDVMGRL